MELSKAPPGWMAPLFRRHSNLECFFCRSNVGYPQNTRNFKCPSCGCWNRYDDNGEILSDEPAMHNEQLNYKSFSKRASPSKHDIPSLYATRPFCHTCQTNQTLLVNLLSNYLPAPESPDYQQRLSMLPAYKESLHLRYPPVCEKCAPLVEEEIKRKEQMARVKALGGWLSKGKDRQRKVSSTKAELERERSLGSVVISETVFWWRLRGVLWGSSFVFSLLSNLAALRGSYAGQRWSFLGPVIPVLVLASLLWTAWDPTYASFHKSQLQGRDVRQYGKRLYNSLQISTWLLRLISSFLFTTHWFYPHLALFDTTSSSTLSTCLILYLRFSICVEILSLSSALFIPRLLHPPAIRLVDTNAHRTSLSRGVTPAPSSSVRSPTPAIGLPEHDILSTLSLSSNPIITTPTNVANPMFGVPSLQTSTSAGGGPRGRGTGGDLMHSLHLDNSGNPRSTSLPPRFATTSHRDPSLTPPDEDQMDWTPTVNNQASGSSNHGPHHHQQNKWAQNSAGMMGHGRASSVVDSKTTSDTAWLRPQRFFAPEKPTGLEGLLASTRLQEEFDGSSMNPSSGGRGPSSSSAQSIRGLLERLQAHVRRWSTLYALGVGLFIPVFVGVGVYEYYRRKIPIP